jgi:hypothetical protein
VAYNVHKDVPVVDYNKRAVDNNKQAVGCNKQAVGCNKQVLDQAEGNNRH